MYLITEGLEKFLMESNVFKNLSLKFLENIHEAEKLNDEIIILRYNNWLSNIIKKLLKKENLLIILYDDTSESPEKNITHENTIIINMSFLENEHFHLFLSSLLKCLKSKLNHIQMLNEKIFDLAIASTNVLEEKERIEQLAIRDGLTGLYNHAYFQETLNKTFLEAKRYGKNFSLIIIDIDHFKKVNDTYGHLAGDLVLKEFANILVSNSRKSDIIARYGGEEFSVILTNTFFEGAKQYLEKLMFKISNHIFDFQNSVFKITFSAGFTQFKDSYESAKDMLDKADKALYISKNNGRNRYTYLE
ncbi:GGDEF domain-containing protein [Deferribacter autotrophicus]|uniref:diguanylate cyclase n=1 Tax=Deferribacter autotrophicus TaxID=500465 RepID=A0A5A8F072_9BACT|nr:GGDEF domain-containing protein [Deferribacter autotrophicus]KAA0257376.1 GGDEF domain-containing protein [Deferribacter autotrophicus]